MIPTHFLRNPSGPEIINKCFRPAMIIPVHFDPSSAGYVNYLIQQLKGRIPRAWVISDYLDALTIADGDLDKAQE
jgi:hypothetical protein